MLYIYLYFVNNLKKKSFQCTFKRAVSVKLPLPANVEVENESSHNEIAVLQKSDSGWELVDTKYRFTRTTVTSDVKYLTRYFFD